MKNWNQQDLERYFKTYYAPNNCVVVVSGAIKMEKVKEFAKNILNQFLLSAPKVHIVEPKQTGERKLRYKRGGNSLPYDWLPHS
jgi:predicted Zn-dependent peptidase